MSVFSSIFKAVLLPALLVSVCVSCDRQDANGIIPERTMVDVVYDYQLAVALAETEESSKDIAEKEYLYTRGVFKKYGITERQYELSVAHYARNPKTMMEITDKVSERYAKEIEQNAEKERNDDGSRSGMRYDTLMLWQAKHDVLLSASANNCYVTEIPCKNLKRGARLMVGFNSSWVYREGAKQGYYQVSIAYSNDSTYTQGNEIREFDARQGTSVFLSDHYDVRSVSLRIYQDAAWKPFPQMLCLNDLRAWSITSHNVGKSAHGNKKGGAKAGSPAADSEKRSAVNEKRSAIKKESALP